MLTYRRGIARQRDLMLPRVSTALGERTSRASRIGGNLALFGAAAGLLPLVFAGAGIALGLWLLEGRMH